MSIFGPNQVGELIIGDAVATETTSKTFVATASDKEIKVLSKDGTAPTVGKPFYVLQKAAAAIGGYEFSDEIDPRYIERITVSDFAAEVQKVVQVQGFTPAANTTYEVQIRLYNDGGSLSPENFAIIQGFYVTGSNITGITATIIRDAVMASLQSNLTHRGGTEFVLAATASPLGFTITGQYQAVVPGKIIGMGIQFDVQGKSFSNAANILDISENTGLITSAQTVGYNPGKGTGKYAQNYEWFTKGYKYDDDRLAGWPADFPTPYYADPAGQYSTIDIKYFKPRKETSVERQYKVLTIMVKAGADTVVTDLETITGYTLNNPGTTLVGGLPGPQGPIGPAGP